MEFENHKVTEVLLALRFNAPPNAWDVVAFADFFKEIQQNLGYSKKEQRQAVTLQFQIKPGEEPPAPQYQEGNIQMIFRTEDNRHAIIWGENYLSVHSINHYDGWKEDFKPNRILPILEKYNNLGLDFTISSAQVVYINKIDLPGVEPLSSYLSFVPIFEAENCYETGYFSNSTFKINDNTELSIKAGLEGIKPTRYLTFEINCIRFNVESNLPWEILAEDARETAKKAFKKISKEQIK